MSERMRANHRNRALSLSRRQMLAAVPAGGLVAAGLAGCTGSASSSSSGKMLVAAGGSTFTKNFNPFAANPVTGTWGMIYEPLYFFNQAKAGDEQPLLATKYEFGPDGKTITFTLREGVKWSDGKPFTADDVVFTFEMIRTNPKVSKGWPLAKVAKTDATHVTLTFSKQVYTQLWQIAGQTWIVPRHIWSSIKDPTTTTNNNPVGTGPFVLGTFQSQAVTYLKNGKYWEPGKPKIAGVRYVALNSNDSLTAELAADQVGWAGGFITNIDKQYVAKDPKHHKYLNEATLYVTNLVPNLDKAPFNDVRVRKAISAALDRDRLIKLAFSGYGKYPNPAEIVQPLYNRYIKPEYRNAKLDHDPEKSKTLLRQAGYTKGSDGYYAKNGQPLSITCKVVTGYSDYISALQIIQQELKAVGIKFSSQQVSWAEFSSDQATGNFDMIITNGYGGPSPYFMYNNLLSSTMTAPIGQNASQNFSRFRNEDVDKALRTIESTDPKDEQTLLDQYYAIQDIVVEQMPYIPIQQSSALAEYNTRDFSGWPTLADHYALVLPFYQPDMGIVAKNLVPVD